MKWKLGNNILSKCFCNPILIGAYGIFLYNVCYVCHWGNDRSKLSVLSGCGIVMILHLLVYIGLYIFIARKSEKKYYAVADVNNERIFLKYANDEMELSFDCVRQVWRHRNTVFFIRKDWIYVQCDISNLDVEQRNFLLFKMNSLSWIKKYFWEKVGLAVLISMTWVSGVGIWYYAQPFNGQLAWVINDLQSTTEMDLSDECKNIYETGGVFLDEILKHIGAEQMVSISDSFSLSFERDGTIKIFDVFINVFDKKGTIVSSYLISYDKKKSNKVMIHQSPSVITTYDAEKDFRVLIQALNVIDFKSTVKPWNEEQYGILYYGVRNWYSDFETIKFINKNGETWKAGASKSNIRGYSISVYCPNTQGILPVRYIYSELGIPMMQPGNSDDLI